MTSDLEQRATELMIRAAENGGATDPDPEQLHWSNAQLFSYGTQLFPDETYRFAAYRAWREYQGS